MTTGLTVDDIIDKLLTADPPRSGKRINERRCTLIIQHVDNPL